VLQRQGQHSCSIAQAGTHLYPVPLPLALMWIDTHCHLDATEFGTQTERLAIRERARGAGVTLCVYPAVEMANLDAVRQLAHDTGDAYALGIHPLYVPRAADADLQRLEDVLQRHADDPRLVAVGEIGLDFFVPALCEPAMRQRQMDFYRAQLVLARRYGLPVILHVRRSADMLLKHLRNAARLGQPVAGGIAHAFSGSEQQARAFVDLGFKLGFGGAVTFDAARQLRRLAAGLPADSLVLETDAPDIPPQWLYVNAAERATGRAQPPNTSAELPAIGAQVASLRGLEPADWARQSTANALAALPKLRHLLDRATTG
jgi:TatD DNase family protein